MLFFFCVLFVAGCYHFRIDEHDRVVPKRPNWRLATAVRSDLERIDFNAVYIGRHESGYWFVRFWESGQIKIFVSDEKSEWRQMKSRDYGGVGYFSLSTSGRIELEYFSVVAQGVYMTAIGKLRKDGSIAIEGLQQRGRKLYDFPFVLVPEVQISRDDPDWNWIPDW